jgi:hypothetical protein
MHYGNILGFQGGGKRGNIWKQMETNIGKLEARDGLHFLLKFLTHGKHNF